MMLQEFKQYISDRWAIFKLNLRFQFQVETVSIFDNWGNVLSTVFYNLLYLAFINVLYANIDLIAGYTKNEMLLLTLFAQVGYYLFYALGSQNSEDMVASVNSGSLDLTLLKPYPHLFHISTKKISMLGFVRDGLPNLIVIGSVISWVGFGLSNTLLAILIFIFGQFCVVSIDFIICLTVFLFGKADAVRDVGLTMLFHDKLPMDGYPNFLKVLFTVVVPVLFTTGLATHVMLGRLNGMATLAGAVILSVIFAILRVVLWNKAMKLYTSASS